jgi:hypothetical protein
MRALAAARYAPPAHLARLAAAVGADAGPRSVADALWGFAVLQHEPEAMLQNEARLVAGLQANAASRRGARDAARTAWALAALRCEASPLFAAALAAAAAAPPGALDGAALSQLHLAAVAASAARVDPPPGAGPALAAASDAAAARAASLVKAPTVLQAEVAAALAGVVGKRAVSVEGIDPVTRLPVDALISVDALASPDTSRLDRGVAVEADGPSHWLRGASTVPAPDDGATALKTRMLTAAGWTVVRVRADAWGRLDGAGRAAWALEALVGAGAVPG